MYIEHDIYIPYKSYIRNLENFQILYPKAFPGLVRVETKDHELYAVDVTRGHNLEHKDLIGGKWFVPLHNSYNASWILPMDVLMETMPSNFYSLTGDTKRKTESGAAYLIRLKKPILVEVEDEKISKFCLVHHLTNNYVYGKRTRFGRMKLNELLYYPKKEKINEQKG
jgi:hypothetical protein